MASFNMIIPELPAYLDSIGGQEYKGLIIGLFALAALISRPFSGRLADTIGRIPVMIIGPLVCIVLGLLYPFTTSIIGFLVLRFFHGFSTGFKPTGTTAYLADIVPSTKRGEAMGFLGVAGSIGMAGGPVIGSWLAQTFSMQIMFWISSLIAGLSILVLMGMKETLNSKISFSPRILLIHPKDVIEPTVWLPSVIMLLTVYAFGTILTIAPDNSDYLQLGNRGIFFSIMLGASILVRFFSGKISDRFGRANVLIIGTLLLTVSLLVLGGFQSKMGFFGGAVLFGLSAGINSPTIFAWTADLAKEHARGKAMSTMFIALELGIILGSVFGAEFYNNQTDQFRNAYWAASVLALLAFFIVTWKRNHYK